MIFAARSSGPRDRPRRCSGARIRRAGAGTSEGRARARRASAGPAQGGSLARPRIGDAARSGIAPRGGGGPQRADDRCAGAGGRSEEHTSELQSLMRNSYAVFCLKKKIRTTHTDLSHNTQETTYTVTTRV